MAIETTRRELLITGGLAAMMLADERAGATAAPASGMSAEERANVQVLKAYLGSWNGPTLDIDQVMATFIAPAAQIRLFDDEPVTVGPAATAASAKRGAGNDVRVTTRFLRIFACGPMIASSRIDTLTLPGKPPEHIPVAGYAIIRNGQIHEYCDYILVP